VSHFALDKKNRRRVFNHTEATELRCFLRKKIKKRTPRTTVKDFTQKHPHYLTMQFLTEDRIKRAGLRFLKSHYRQRERSGAGKSEAHYDVVTEGGIIVDVHLKFITPEGASFQAAMEATSALTKEEVTYRLQKTLLILDSLAAATIIAAMIFSYSYAFDQFTISQIGFIYSLLLMFLLIFVIGCIYALLVKWRNRYQYIYAIEQFKKYHVDEQWIAIGEDVFENREDEIYLELVEQCVVNGFGLIEINFEEKASLLITPSRNEIFGKERGDLAFGRRDSALKRGRVVRAANLWNEKVANKVRIPGAEQLKRFQLGYVRQILLTGFGFFLIGAIFHIEMQQTEVVYIDEKVYEEQMYRFSEETDAELEEYVLDSIALAPIVAEEPGYLETMDAADYDLEDSEQDEYYSDTDFIEDLEQLPLLEFDAVPNEDFKIILATENGLQVRYDCERLYNLEGRYFFVLDGLYIESKEALKRVARLHGAELPVNAFSMECFAEGDRRYLVYYDLFYDSEKETGKALSRYRKLLKKRGFSNKKVRTYSIEISR
jgi:hypothetical protein